MEENNVKNENRENKPFTFNINGNVISVTKQEIIDFYQRKSLTETNISDREAMHVALMKLYKSCDDYLDKEYVHRLLREERLMKAGETDGFNIKLDFEWSVKIYKTKDPYFKYGLIAYCLDNPQSFSRRYTSLQFALLHCLNGFNENTSVRNKYRSIDDYLSKE